MYLPLGRAKVVTAEYGMKGKCKTIDSGIFLCLDDKQDILTFLVHECLCISVEKPKEYVCQVFCHEDSINQWRFVFAFVESKHLDVSKI